MVTTRILTILIALLLAAPLAQAGDYAYRDIIGFSPDGRYFAFERYGQLDAGTSASGYSEIDIIDTRSDEFIGGKPIVIVDASQGGATAASSP